MSFTKKRISFFLDSYVGSTEREIKISMRRLDLELDTILILAAWPVSVMIYHILVLVGRYFGQYFQV